MCEHYCVNIHLWIASLNAIVPCMCMHKASLSTSTSTTLPLAYHHVSPSVNTVWTLLCEHPSTNCFFKCIVPCMCMYKASLSTSTSTTLPLAYHHVSPSVNIVWTLLCEHPSTNCFFKCYCTMHVHACKFIIYYTVYHHVHLWTCVNTTLHLWIASLNHCHHVWCTMCEHCVTVCEHACTNCFFKCIVPCMCMYKASLSTSTSTTLPLAYHHMLTFSEHCVNMHLPIASWNWLQHVCPGTM